MDVKDDIAGSLHKVKQDIQETVKEETKELR